MTLGAAALRLGTVATALEREVQKRPNAMAIVGENESLTYAELWERAGALARELRHAGAGPGAHVAILRERSVELVVLVVAATCAGCAFVPLDPDDPPHRLEAKLEDFATALVVGSADFLAPLSVRHAADVEGLLLATRGQPQPRPASADALPHARRDDLAYIISTSGSTGAPKGVMMHHGGLAHMLEWFLDESSCGVGDRTLQSTPLHFDVSLQEIFGTLCSGGTLVCCTETQRNDPALLWKLLVDAGVHRIHLPFVLLQLLALFADAADLERCLLREVCCGGEQLQCTEPIRELFRRLPDCTLFNHYGATEVWMVSSHRLPPDVDSWPAIAPIGKPIPGMHVHVCDEDTGVPLPPGEMGELVAGGPSTGPGYWRRPAMTAERFIPNRFGDGDRVYRTGDLVRTDADGVLTYVGRHDTQIKLRGNRIELGELEVFLNSQPEVQEAVVVAVGEGLNARLEAFVVAHSAGVDDVLYERLERQFPASMLPSRIRRLDALPRTRTGKANRHFEVLEAAAAAGDVA